MKKNMKKTRKIISLILVSAMVLSMAGCGSSGSESMSSAATTVNETTNAAPETEEETTEIIDTTDTVNEDTVSEDTIEELSENKTNRNNLRRIPLANAKNFRDLGGYPAADGKVTKWGILYRSDKLSNLTEDDWDTLEDLGVSTIIDLRGEDESAANPITPSYSLDYFAIPLMDTSGETYEDEALAANSQFAQSMQNDYVSTLFGNLPGMVNILDTILDKLSTDDGAIVFLCSAGKDRTGITAALLLYLCGVSDVDICADYMVSSNYNGGVDIERVRSSLTPEMLALLPEDDDELLKVMGSDPDRIQELLDVFEAVDIRKYLADNGFSEEKQNTLAELMTE